MSVHDVGGKPGFGAPNKASSPGINGSAFAARWEAGVFAMMRCLGGAGVMKNTDQFRHAVERVDPEAYFSHGYYGRWLGGLETLLVEASELERGELDARVKSMALSLGATQERVEQLVADYSIASRTLPPESVDQVASSVNAGSSVRYVAQPPKYRLGERVKAVGYSAVAEKSAETDGAAGQFFHTRLPAYAQNCEGVIADWHRGWVLPDTNAHQGAEEPTHLYSVAFSARALYGDTAERGVTVHLDLFEPYLLAVTAKSH